MDSFKEKEKMKSDISLIQEKIKEEIRKFPKGVPYHFMNFYEENKDVLQFLDEKKISDKTQE